MDCKATPPFGTSLKGGTGKLGKRAGLYLGGGQGLWWGESFSSALKNSRSIVITSITSSITSITTGN